jgi:hypothetical protein
MLKKNMKSQTYSIHRSAASKGSNSIKPGVVFSAGTPNSAEYPGLVDPSLCDQEMEMGVEVDPIAEGLDGGDDPGDEVPIGKSAKIGLDGRDRRPAEVPGSPGSGSGRSPSAGCRSRGSVRRLPGPRAGNELTPSRNGPRRLLGNGRSNGTAPDRGPCAPDGGGGRFPTHPRSRFKIRAGIPEEGMRRPDPRSVNARVHHSLIRKRARRDLNPRPLDSKSV